MTAKLLDGKALSNDLKQEVAEEVETIGEKHGITPGLSVILVGDDPASEFYVKSKAKACRKAGINSETYKESSDITTGYLVDMVQKLNADDEVDGILVQMPLPDHIDTDKVINSIDPKKDVDGFHPVNVGKLTIDGSGLIPCTPKGMLELLNRENIEIEGANAVVVGRSDIVGKPMGLLLLHNNATVTWCHSRTRDLERITGQADILVAAVGVTAFIGKDHIKEGATVLDVGINKVENKDDIIEYFGEDEERLEKFEDKGYTLAGDVHPMEAREKAGALTPVPGGVGPLTIAMLLKNTVEACRKRRI